MLLASISLKVCRTQRLLRLLSCLQVPEVLLQLRLVVRGQRATPMLLESISPEVCRTKSIKQKPPLLERCPQALVV